MNKFLFSFLLILLLVTGFQEAQARECGAADGTLSPEGVLTFPDGVCTSIADSAFSHRSDIYSAVIPDGVTSIGAGAFVACTALASIDLPESLTSIGNLAFRDCSSLTSINLPDNLTSIEGSVFRGCTGLASIDLPDNLTSIGDSAFRDCSSLTSINLPDSVRSIGVNTFCGLKDPSSVVVNEGSPAYNLLKDAFYSIPYADSWTTLVVNPLPTETPTDTPVPTVVPTDTPVPTDVPTDTPVPTDVPTNTPVPTDVPTDTPVPTDVPTNTPVPTDVPTNTPVPTDVPTDTPVPTDVPTNTPVPTDVPTNTPVPTDVPTNTPVPTNTSIVPRECGAADGTVSPEGVLTFPEGVCTSIAEEAFRDRADILSAVIPEGVTSIGELAFRGCRSLASINLPNSVRSIGDTAFAGCAFTSIDLPYGITSIGKYTFNGCNSLTSINLPASLNSIGDNAFSFCRALTSIDLPDGLASIEANTFDNCTALASIDLPNSLASIGDNAFYNCSSLTSIDLPNSLASIGHGAFNSCTALASIDLPDNLASIGASAFNDCTALASIDLPDNLASIGHGAFRGLKDPSSVVVNEGSSAYNLLKDRFYSEPYADSWTTLVVNPLPTETPTNTPVPTGVPTNTPVPTDVPTNTPVPTGVPNVSLAISVDKSEYSIGDRLTYLMRFSNTGEGIAENVTLRTYVPSGTRFSIASYDGENTDCQISPDMTVVQCNVKRVPAAYAQLALEVIVTNPTGDILGAAFYDEGNPAPLSLTDPDPLKRVDANPVKPKPVPTDVPTNTPVPTGVPTDTPVPTGVPTNTPVPTGVPTDTPVPTGVPTNTPVPTGVPTDTPVPTGVPTDTPVPTGVPTDTPVPTGVPTSVPTAAPNVSVMMAVDKSEYSIGDQLTYTMRVSNTGEGTAANVTLRDYLPIGTVLVQSDPICQMSPDGSFLQCNVESISARNGIKVVAFTVEVRNPAGYILNTAFYDDGNPAPLSFTDPDPMKRVDAIAVKPRSERRFPQFNWIGDDCIGMCYDDLEKRLCETGLPATGITGAPQQALSNADLALKYERTGIHIEIPSLDQSQDIRFVPFTDGEYDVADLGMNIGLLELSSLPGEGLSILSAHNHLNNMETGPFALLSSMEIGDRIFVTGTDNQLTVFSVYDNQLIDRVTDHVLAGRVNGHRNPLVLITCENESVEGGYLNRRLIFAEQISN